MVLVPDPPSASILPSLPELNARLASALREVELVRRLIRAAKFIRPDVVSTSNGIGMAGHSPLASEIHADPPRKGGR